VSVKSNRRAWRIEHKLLHVKKKKGAFVALGRLQRVDWPVVSVEALCVDSLIHLCS
jgi:hypothetical protein